MKKFLICGLMSALLAACGVPQAEHDKIIAENTTLKAELDELKNGEERLIAIIEKSYEDKAYKDIKDAVKKLKDKHPQSKFIETAEAIGQKAAKAEQARIDKEVVEAAERVRLANLDNTGIWQVTTYVDDFGEPLNEKIIMNSRLIKGTFSNTATQASDLTVRFLIDGPKEVDIKLYEYAGNNPVKAYSPDEYRVLMQGNDGKRHTLKAFNRGDRLSFGPQHSSIIFKELKKGGEVKFRIIEVETPTTNYAFTIKNAEYFDNAARLMDEK